MGWFDELEKEIKKAEEADKKKQTKKQEVKDAEIIEKPAVEDKKEVSKKEEKPKKTSTKKEAKKTTKVEKTGLKAIKKEKYLYPFQLYADGDYLNIDNYGFEDGKEYSPNEITEIMRSHKKWSFFGNVEYNFMEKDNVLLANFTQHKKG